MNTAPAPQGGMRVHVTWAEFGLIVEGTVSGTRSIALDYRLLRRVTGLKLGPADRFELVPHKSLRGRPRVDYAGLPR